MDVINFVKLVAGKHPANIPLFVSGESFGGCLALLASKYFQDHPHEAPSNFDSTLLICPAIDGDLPPLPVYLLLRYVLAPMFPTKTVSVVFPACCSFCFQIYHSLIILLAIL